MYDQATKLMLTFDINFEIRKQLVKITNTKSIILNWKYFKYVNIFYLHRNMEKLICTDNQI